MKRAALRPVAFLAASVTTLAVAGISSLGDTIVAIEDGFDSGGIKTCGVWCNGQWRGAGSCFSSQNCCGWYNCFTNAKSLTCCNATQVCEWGGDTNPPSPAKCIVAP